ncbi:hypothetical protein Tco_1516478 [Tanacetum coccineum]
MDLETAQTTTTAKLPILKQGEYDMWRLRIEQYFQVQDYALWDVIENGNSFKPVGFDLKLPVHETEGTPMCVYTPPLYSKTLNIRILEEIENVQGLSDGTKSYLVRIVKNIEPLNYINLISLAMAAPRPANQVARCAIDELMDFSKETQLNAMISKMEAMGDQEEVYDSLMCLRDDKRAKNHKIIA